MKRTIHTCSSHHRKPLQQKRADADTFKIVVGMLITIVVAIILIILYKGWFSSTQGPINESFHGLKDDCDNDGLVDGIDPCICSDEETCNTGTSEAKANCEKSTKAACTRS